MRYARIPIAAVAAALMTLIPFTAARAQVCLGLPADDGQMALEARVTTTANGDESGYGGRLGVNFDTEYSLDIGVDRPRLDHGLGTTASAVLGYESLEYEPSMCMFAGMRYDTRPTATGEATSTMIPLGLGVGKRLGSANTFSLALFLRPEYLYVLEPDPVGEFETFWDELGHRSEGRGVLGVMVSTPLLYGIGEVQVATLDGLAPALAVGAGIMF